MICGRSEGVQAHFTRFFIAKKKIINLFFLLKIIYNFLSLSSSAYDVTGTLLFITTCIINVNL